MKQQIGRRGISVSARLIMFLVLAVDVARADSQHVYFSDEAQWTWISCAIILAAGMIVAAVVLRRPK